MNAFWRGFYVGLQKMGALLVAPRRWRQEWDRIDGRPPVTEGIGGCMCGCPPGPNGPEGVDGGPR